MHATSSFFILPMRCSGLISEILRTGLFKENRDSKVLHASNFLSAPVSPFVSVKTFLLSTPVPVKLFIYNVFDLPLHFKIKNHPLYIFHIVCGSQKLQYICFICWEDNYIPTGKIKWLGSITIRRMGFVKLKDVGFWQKSNTKPQGL